MDLVRKKAREIEQILIATTSVPCIHIFSGKQAKAKPAISGTENAGSLGDWTWAQVKQVAWGVRRRTEPVLTTVSQSEPQGPRVSI